MPEEGVELRDRHEFMTHEEIIAIAGKFVQMGVKKIRLTGGEPLVRKDVEMVISELGKMPIDLSITTNGILVDRFITHFKQAGIQSVNVSLDSLQKDRFHHITRRDQFDKVYENIQLLISNGFNVKVNVVLMRGVNDDEIIDFVEWTKDTPVSIRFIEFMPFDGNNWESEKKVSFSEIMNILEEHYGEEVIQAEPEEQNATSRNFSLSGSIGSFGVISTVTNPFCDSCNRIRLTADGKVKNCLFSNDEIDILTAYRNEEPIDKLIQHAVRKKHKERAGFSSFDNETAGRMDNRSMITIGG